MPLTEQDARQVMGLLPSLSPENQQKARQALGEYQAARQSAGEPLFPEWEQQQLDAEKAYRGMFADLKTVDKVAPSIVPMLEWDDQPDETRARVANTSFLSRRYGKSADEIDGEYDLYRSDYARNSWDNYDELSDTAFHALAAKEVQHEADAENLMGSLDQYMAQAAVAGEAFPRAFGDWQKWAEDKPGYEPHKSGRIMRAAEQAHRQLSNKLEPYREVVEAAAYTALYEFNAPNIKGDAPKEIKSADEIAELLLDVPEPDRPMVFRSIIALAKLRSGEDDNTFLDKMILRLGRGASNLAGNAAGAIKRGFIEKAEAVPDFFVDLVKGEGAASKLAAGAKREKDRMLLAEQFRRVAEGEIAPLTSSYLVGRGILGAAEMVPMTLASLVPYVGPASMLAQFNQETYLDLRLSNPEMSDGTASAIAAFAAPLQAVSEVVSDRFLIGRLPTLARAVKAPVTTRAGAVALFGRQLVLGTTVEMGEEHFQQLVPLAFQQVADALAADVPGVDWSGYLKRNFSAEFNTELLAQILPLSLIGAGFATFDNLQHSRSLALSSAGLEAAGYTPEVSAKVVEAAKQGDWEGAQNLMRQNWNAAEAAGIKPMPEAERRAVADAVAETQAMQAAKRTAIRRAENGWEVSTQEGGTVSKAVFPTHEEAFAAMQTSLASFDSQAEQTTLDALNALSAKAVAGEEFAVTDALGTLGLFQREAESRKAEAAKSGDKEAEMQAEADLQAIWNRHAVENERLRAAGRPEAGLDDLQVLGQSITHFREGVAVYSSRLFRGGGAIDLVEEKAENDVRRAIGSKRTTVERMATLIREAEQATGDKYLHGFTDGADADADMTAVVEGYSSLARLYVTGTKKTGLASASRRGQLAESRALRQRLKASADGKLGSLLRQELDFWKAVLGQVVRLARAKKEGRLGEIEQFLRETTQLQEQEAHTAGVENEVSDWVDESLLPDYKPPTAEQEAAGMAFSLAPAFYSKLERTIEAKMPARADAATIRGILTNPQNGIKAEELKWSGIMPWLDSQPAPITKQAVLDYLATDGAVRLEEVRMGEDGARDAAAWWNDEGGANEETPWEELSASEQRDATERYKDEVGQYEEGATKFSQYQLPGGENYREVVLAMPTADKSKSATYEQRPNGKVSVTVGGYARIMPNMDAAREWAAEYGASDTTPNYTSSHFPDVPNYVAHMRLNDRADADGKPGTFIEEIQSDRHQAGREKGYAGGDIAGLDRSIIDKTIERGRAIAAGDSETALRLENEIRGAQIARAGAANGIPDAPFRTTWPLQMFKRALAEAVATGKKWIGWTTGETQAERYDLSKQVDSIGWRKDDSGASLTVMKGGEDLTGDLGLNRRIPLEELPGIIGKEAAKKIIEGGRAGKLSGDDLKVGGEGMRGFYDNILPKEIGKYVKQWGAGVVKGSIGQRADNATWKVRYDNGRSGTVYTQEAADEAQEEGAKVTPSESVALPIWRVDITPQMAEGVARGQSSFSLSNSPLRAMFSGNAEYRSEAERIALTERAAAELGGGQTFLPKRFVVRPADTHRLFRGKLAEFVPLGEGGAVQEDEGDGGRYGPLLASAGEHAVYHRPGDAHVTKLTLPGFYGYVPVEDIATGSVADGAPFKRLHLEMATAAEYLHRTALFSREFGIPWKISHVEANDEGPLIVSTQPFVDGVDPTEKEVRAYMASRGYEEVWDETGDVFRDPRMDGTTFFKAGGQILATDVRPQNFKRTEDGRIVPLDIMLAISPRSREQASLALPPGAMSGMSLRPFSRLVALGESLESAAIPPEARRKMQMQAAMRLKSVVADAQPLLDASRTLASLERERRFREADARQRILDDEMSKLSPATLAAFYGDAALADAREHPLIANLLVRDQRAPGGWRGRLSSRTRAKGAPEYDDMPSGLPSWFFGGRQRPDVLAQEMYEEGLIVSPYADVFWREVESAFKTAWQAKADIAQARDAVKAAEKQAAAQAKAEADQWYNEARKKVESPKFAKAKLLEWMRILDAVLSPFPGDLRARVGGFIRLAQLSTDEARAREVVRRVERMGVLLESHLQKELREEIGEIVERNAAQKENGISKGRLSAGKTAVFNYVRDLLAMDDAAQEAELGRLEAVIGTATDADEQAEALSKWGIASLFAGYSEQTAQQLDAALAFLRQEESGGRLARSVLDEARKAEIEADRESIKKGLSSKPVSDVDEYNWRAEHSGLVRWADWFMGMVDSALLTTMQQLDAVLGQDHAFTRKTMSRLRKAHNQREDLMRELSASKREMLHRVFNTKSDLVALKRLGELQRAVKKTGVFIVQNRSAKKVRFPAEKVRQFIEGGADPAAFGLNDAAAEDLAVQWADDPEKSSYEVEIVESAGNEQEIGMSRMEALQFLMSWNQPGIRESMEANGWSEDSAAQLRAFAGEEGVAIMDWMRSWYDRGYDIVNAVHERVHHAPLPRNENYSPVYRKTANTDHVTDLEMRQMGSGLAAGFVKGRVRNNLPLHKIDAITAFLSHWEQVAHWSAYAEIVRDIRAVLLDRQVSNTIKVKRGPSAMSNLQSRVSALEDKGTSAAFDLHQLNTFWHRLNQYRAFKGLAFRLSPIIKQTSAILNPLLYDVPADAYAAGLARLMAGQLELGEAWNSPTIQRRLMNGFSPEARIAMSAAGANAGVLIALMQKGMVPMQWTDAAWNTAGAAIAFDYYLRQARRAGANEAEARNRAADRMDDMIQQAAQPNDLANRSLVENFRSPFVKSLWMFASESRKTLAIEYVAARRLLTGKSKNVTADVRRIAVAHLAQGAVTQLMASFYALLLGDDDDRERAWSEEAWLAALEAGPINGLFVAGGMVEMAIRRFNGLPWFRSEQPIVRAANDAISGAANLDDLFGDDEEKLWKEIDRLSSATAAILSATVSPAAGAPDVLANAVREAAKAAD